jgi:hypothetical protein
MSIVYKYLSPDLKECYVGSTTNEYDRKRCHKSIKSNKTNSKLLFDKYGYDNCSYIVLEVCPVEEQRTKEQWWLDHSVGVVNKIRVFRTEDQLREYNKNYGKVRYEVNKEDINDRKKAYYEANKEEILKHQRAYIEANREAINEKRRISRQANNQTKIKTTAE